MYSILHVCVGGCVFSGTWCVMTSGRTHLLPPSSSLEFSLAASLRDSSLTGYGHGFGFLNVHFLGEKQTMHVVKVEAHKVSM